MDDVKRYVASWHMQEFYVRHDGDIVRFQDHKAALDAQRLRAVTAQEQQERHREAWFSMKTERDVERLRADTAEAARDALRAVLEGAQYQSIEGFYGMGINDCKMVGDEVAHITKAIQRERNSLRSDLTAAEQRIAEQLELLREVVVALSGRPELGVAVPAYTADRLRRRIYAALNPKPEAGSHE